jgi:alpha-galactosidase
MDDGLALTPPMGWNSWNAFACDIDEALIEETAELIVESGMRDAGYRFVNLDDGWMAATRDEAGKLSANPERFPHGMEALADHIHNRGLLFGIYEDAGSQTCAGNPGSRDHYGEDAATFAAWGVDFLKFDWCYTERTEHPRRLYAAMRDALRDTGHPIVYSICCWGVDRPWMWGAETGHLWRTTGDIVPAWDSVMNILDQQVPLARYAGPGHWNDPDMLEVGNGGMTVAEERSHFGLWSMLAAPLICGNDIRSMSVSTKDILLNREVIAVNQDPAAIAAERIWRGEDEEVWARPLANGDYAVLFLNRGFTSKAIGVSVGSLGLPSEQAYVLRDLWSGEEMTAVNDLIALVPPRASAMVRVRRGDPTDAPTGMLLCMDRRVFVPGGLYEVTLIYRRLDGHRPAPCRLALRGPVDWELSPLSGPRLGEDRAVRQRWRIEVPGDAHRQEYELVLTASSDEAGNSSVLLETREVALVTGPFAAASGYLSDANWLQAVNGCWTVGHPPVGLDRSATGSVLSIGGQTYGKGLGVHAFSQLWYYLGGSYTEFAAAVGMDDAVSDVIPFGRESLGAGTGSFEVWADDRRIYESGIIERGEPARSLRLSVEGADILKLSVTDGGDGTYQDQADWAEARVLFDR